MEFIVESTLSMVLQTHNIGAEQEWGEVGTETGKSDIGYQVRMARRESVCERAHAQSTVNDSKSIGASAHHVKRIGVDICRLDRVDLHLEL
jgi:hypothetical protein